MNVDRIQSEFETVKNKLHGIEIVASERAQKMDFMKEAVDRIEIKIEGLVQEKKREHDDFREKISAIETWKAVFVAKLSIYSAVGITFGTIIAQLLVRWVSDRI